MRTRNCGVRIADCGVVADWRWRIADWIADWRIAVVLIIATASLAAVELKVDLSKEQVGRPPATFEPMVGTWVVVQDGGEKAIMVDGRPWIASKDNPTKL